MARKKGQTYTPEQKANFLNSEVLKLCTGERITLFLYSLNLYC